MLDAYRRRRDAGDTPRVTEYRVLHIEQQGSDAVALLYRRTGGEARPRMIELRLRRYGQTWLVTGETVTPWPETEVTVGTYLRPREAASAHVAG